MFGASYAHAQYPSAKPNFGVREELEGDSNRLIPVHKHFAFAVDGEGFLRNSGTEEFYHGIGHWTQVRSEAAPHDFMRVNLRSIFFAGSCSGGYAAPSGDYHLLSLSGRHPGTVFGGTVSARALDLDRQTFGAGLLVQQKEFNGIMFRWENGDHELLLRGDGTGLFRLNDDTYAAEASIFKKLFGVGGSYWTQGRDQDHLAKNRAPYHYVFSAHTFDWFSYGAELGTRGGPSAGMLALTARKTLGDFTGEMTLEGRRYNDGFAEDFAGRIEQQYVAYDQYDKNFTNAANVFVTDDDVNVGAAQVNLRWKLSHEWRLHSLNETGKLDFRSAAAKSYYYFRHGIEYCPIADRDDCVNLFASNKVLMNSYARPPSMMSMSNEETFKMVPFVGLEARFRL